MGLPRSTYYDAPSRRAGERGGHQEDGDVVHRVRAQAPARLEGHVGARGQVLEAVPRGLSSVDGKPQAALS